MNLKIFLVGVPIAVAIALFGPQSRDGWKSACGCVNEDQQFAYYVGKTNSWNASGLYSGLSEAQVAEGFLKKIPRGSSIEEIKEKSPAMVKTCMLAAKRVYRCDYWIQFSDTAERGYAVEFALDHQERVASVSARKTLRARVVKEL